jgi:hypothetical protein
MDPSREAGEDNAGLEGLSFCVDAFEFEELDYECNTNFIRSDRTAAGKR